MHQGAIGCEEGPHGECAERRKGGRLGVINVVSEHGFLLSVVCAVASSVVALPFGTCSWPRLLLSRLATSTESAVFGSKFG